VFGICTTIGVFLVLIVHGLITLEAITKRAGDGIENSFTFSANATDKNSSPIIEILRIARFKLLD
jgi:hypothetical protein